MLSMLNMPNVTTRRGPLPFDDVEQAQVDAVVDHVNAHHADTVLLVARHLHPGAAEAELTAVDTVGAAFVVCTADGRTVRTRLAFPTPVVDAHEVQARLHAAVAAARHAADPDAPLTSLEAELAAAAGLATTHGRVAAVRSIAPDLVEVTLTGFDGYPLRGGDEFVYALVSHAPGGIPRGFSIDAGRDRPDDDPVRGAYYTVRRSRPDLGEIDLWVVVHDHPGSVAAWMAAARTGDPIALWGPRRGFAPPAGISTLLLVADETGLAAVAALIEASGPDVSIHALVEVAGASHAPELPAHPGLTVEWVPRRSEPPGAGAQLLDAVVRSVATAPDAAFGAAESRQISAVRRHLRGALGMPASAMQMTGYWRMQLDATAERP